MTRTSSTTTRRHRGSAALLAATLSTAVTLGAGAWVPAAAESGSHTDSTGDVWYFDPGQTAFQHFDGTTFNADIVKVRVQHQHRRVVVTTHYDDLRKHASDTVSQFLDVYTNEDKHFRAVAYYLDGKVGGMVHKITGQQYKKIKCGRILTRFRWGKDTVVSSYSRRCFSKPKSLRWHVQGGLKRGLAGGGYRNFGDDAHTDQEPYTGSYEAKLRRG